MEPRERQVEKYVTSSGKCPFDEWFRRLKNAKAEMAVDARLTRLRQGNLGSHRSVGEGVLELKINFGPGFRVYFGLDGRRLVILLCGGEKNALNRTISRRPKNIGMII